MTKWRHRLDVIYHTYGGDVTDEQNSFYWNASDVIVHWFHVFCFGGRRRFSAHSAPCNSTFTRAVINNSHVFVTVFSSKCFEISCSAIFNENRFAFWNSGAILLAAWVMTYPSHSSLPDQRLGAMPEGGVFHSRRSFPVVFGLKANSMHTLENKYFQINEIWSICARCREKRNLEQEFWNRLLFL